MRSIVVCTAATVVGQLVWLAILAVQNPLDGFPIRPWTATTLVALGPLAIAMALRGRRRSFFWTMLLLAAALTSNAYRFIRNVLAFVSVFTTGRVVHLLLRYSVYDFLSAAVGMILLSYLLLIELPRLYLGRAEFSDGPPIT